MDLKKIDELITALTENITTLVETGAEKEHEVVEKTKALTELVSVRASLF